MSRERMTCGCALDRPLCQRCYVSCLTRSPSPCHAQIFDTSLYSLIRELPRLTGLELNRVAFPYGLPGFSPFSALAGAPLRVLVMHVTRFQDDAQRSMHDTLTSVLASLSQLVYLDMTFPRRAVRTDHGIASSSGHAATPRPLPEPAKHPCCSMRIGE